MKFKVRLFFLFSVPCFFIFIVFVIQAQITSNNDARRYLVPKRNHQTSITDELQARLEEPIFLGDFETMDQRKNQLEMLIKTLKDDLKILDNKIDCDELFKIALSWVKPNELFPERAIELGSILRCLTDLSIINADLASKGSQLKLILNLTSSHQVIFKPMRYSRDEIFNGSLYSGADRHNGEIVAFHISRILNLRKVPLSIGRKIHMRRQLSQVSSERLKATFDSTGSCFGRSQAVCGDAEGSVEGAVIFFYPFITEKFRNPWQRTYRRHRQAKWENQNDYCTLNVMQQFSTDEILDFVDSSIIDFIIGNADRHHHERFVSSQLNTSLIILDNGKSFGNPFNDELSILAPLYQCCMIRNSTYQRLLLLTGMKFSSTVSLLIDEDPLSPLLTEDHLVALDRRLVKIIATVRFCLERSFLYVLR